YHAWNLHGDPRGRLRVIDFQDAMIGPALHDLASLFTDRDSDRFVAPELEAELVELFADELARRGGPRLPHDRLRRDYFAAVAFRTLRVLGRFRFLAIERGRTTYLDYLPRMAAQTRRALRERGDERLLRLRSEEHTSELQSRENLVCRLLLEKKKKKEEKQTTSIQKR